MCNRHWSGSRPRGYTAGNGIGQTVRSSKPPGTCGSTASEASRSKRSGSTAFDRSAFLPWGAPLRFEPPNPLRSRRPSTRFLRRAASIPTGSSSRAAPTSRCSPKTTPSSTRRSGTSRSNRVPARIGTNTRAARFFSSSRAKAASGTRQTRPGDPEGRRRAHRPERRTLARCGTEDLDDPHFRRNQRAEQQVRMA